MATAFLTGLTKVVPAIFDGFSNEVDAMKTDSTPFSFKRIGHGFEAFGKGFFNSITGREPNNHESTRGAQLNG